MPIEIKELHVKINVSESKGAGKSGGGQEQGTDVVQDCLDQVSKMLNDKKER